MKLLIVSHVTHFVWEGGVYAYGPYAREIDIWAELFEEIVIAAPCRSQAPPSDSCRIERGRVRVAPQRELGGESLKEKLALYLATPAICLDLANEMRKAEAIHVRCPGNLGLLGALLAPLFSEFLIAKYAGQWMGFPGEEWTVRLQRAILRSRWWGKPVTVYGDWPGQPKHVISFFTSLLSEAQLAHASRIAETRKFTLPLTVSYSGRLTRSKNVDKLLKSIAAAAEHGVTFRAVIMGDGPEKSSLQQLAGRLGIAANVEFTGGISAEAVLTNLERSDIFVLISETEGWPKALAEAMAFGTVCIGSERGLIPQFLAEGRGIVVPAGDSSALTAALLKIAADPSSCNAMGLAASHWARNYSVEKLRDALRDLMIRSWNLTEGRLASPRPVAEN